MAAKLQVELEVLNRATKELNSIGHDFNSLQNKVLAVGRAFSGIFVGGAITGKVFSELMALRDISKEYTVTQNQMREALGFVSLELAKQADELEDKLKIDDDEISKAQAQFAMYTQNEGIIKQLTRATLDYAGAKGKTLKEATDTITRALGSEQGSVRGLPEKLDGAAGSTERLASVTEVLNKYFHGQAEAVAGSKDALDELKLEYDDVRKSFAIGLFGTADEKEALRTKKAEKYLDTWASSSSILMHGFMESEKEIERMIASGESGFRFFELSYAKSIQRMARLEKEQQEQRAKARRDAHERAAVDAMQNLNLSPAYGSNKEAQKAAQKAAEDQRRLEEELARDSLAIERAFSQAQAAEMKRAQKEQLDAEADARKKAGALESDRLRVEADKIKNYRNEQAAAWRDHYRTIYEDSKSHDELMRRESIAFGQEYGALIGQNLGKGAEGAKNVLRGSLTMIVDYIERKAIAAAASYIFDSAFAGGPAGLIAGFAGAAAITAIGEGAKAGIAGFASGTISAPGSLSMVGENGPELRYIPRGTQIFNSQETKNIRNESRGHTFNITVQSASGDLLDTITTQVRSGTGNVDRFLGAIMKKARI